MTGNHALQVYVFGDQIFNVADLLQSLIQENEDTVVSDFIGRASNTLKYEVAQLSPEQQAACPRFGRLADLVPHYKNGTLNPALVQALVCTAHLGSFVRDHSSGGQAFPPPNESCVAGLCTGALSAPAVSCAWSVASLLPLALRTISVALHLGAIAWEVGARLSPGTEPVIGADGKGAVQKFPSWTAAIAGLSKDEVQEITARFSKDLELPAPAVPYVSAVVGPAHLSVTAPPHVLARFLAAVKSTANASTAPLRISAPYHAAHLYNDHDVAGVVEAGIHRVAIDEIRARIPIISASAPRQEGTYSAQNQKKGGASFSVALCQAAHDCLTRRIGVDKLAARIAAHVSACAAGDVDFCLTAVTGGERLSPTVRSLLSVPRIEDDVRPKRSILPRLPTGAHAPSAQTPIAILAASGRFPHAEDMAEYWGVLARGEDAHELVPPTRWNAAAHVSDDPKLKNGSGSGFGCWLHNAGLVDTTFFNMSPREAPQVEPKQRLALLTAAEALDCAGIVPNRTPSTEKTRVGVYFGSTANDWMETNSAQNIDAYFIPGGNRAFMAGRINYHFKFSGPSYTIDTACSSSFAALHMACNALWKGEIDTAIVGGSNILTNPDMHAGLDKGHFLSRTGPCKTFDDGADGYCRGEAVVTIILKRLPDARVDKDPIEACILGIATNHNAEAESITRPHVGAQKQLFERLLVETGVDANNISYVEMHGTGTQAGDAGETTSVVETLSPLSAQGVSTRPASRPLHIGAAKANIGHGGAAAGVTSLAKVLLMMKNNKIPPHIGIKTKINHKLPDLLPRNTYIAKSLTSWNRPTNGKRRVLLNNFSAAGGNTAMILEDAPLPHIVNDVDPRSHHAVTISAKTPESMLSNLRNMIQWMKAQQSSDQLLSRLSYTTTARRQHHRHRISVIGSQVSQIQIALEDHLARREAGEKSLPVPPKAPSFVFAFTGQGSPYAGMGAELYAHFTPFKADIHRYDKLCTQMELPSIRPLFEQKDAFDQATPTQLQLMHVCLQMALSKLWRSFGAEPTAVVGHSLGEYAALYTAGVLSQADVIHLVGKRAQLMEHHLAPGTHAMLVVKADEAHVLSTLHEELGRECEISCRNGPANVVIGGTTTQMKEAREALERRDVRCQYLDTPFAFHTSQVDPILKHFASLSAGAELKDPSIPVISATYGRVLHSRADFEEGYFVEHCRKSVNMVDALAYAKKEGLLDGNIIGLEIGPAPVVTRMVKEVAGPSMFTFASMQKGQDTWKLMSQSMSQLYMLGVNLDWSRYHDDFPQCQQILELPAYGWNLKNYWIQYVHDWSLRKGEPPLMVTAPALETSALHTVVKNTLSQDGEIVVDADLNREDLHPMVPGHKVYGVPLCTPSVYADIALTIGDYIMQANSLGTQATTAVEVADMTIQSALVANDAGIQQLLRTTVKFDAKSKDAKISFSSVNADGKIIAQHAHCRISFTDIQRRKSALQTQAAHAETQMAALYAQTNQATNTYRFSKAMIYKMVGQLADFDPKYRGLIAITMNNDRLEATGTVSFKGIANEGKWGVNPAYLDALSQLGGFVMNANEGVDLDKELFVNHGWGNMTMFSKLDATKTYHSYVQMKEGGDKLWTGDVYLFDEAISLVGIVAGVALQGVPKRLMSYIVSAANKKVSGVSTVVEPQPPKVQQKRVPATQAAAPVSKPAPAVKTATTGKPATASLTMFAEAMKIVSEEVGVGVESLTDDFDFLEAGLDSLLSLVICSRLRDQLNIELESSDFLTASNVGGLKQILQKFAPAEEKAQPTTIEAPIAQPAPVLVPSNVTTAEAPPQIADAVAQQPANESAWAGAVTILAEESGLAENEIQDHLVLNELGVDSILSLVITSRLRDELEIDLPERALFEDCETVGDLRRQITGSSAESNAGQTTSSGTSTPPSEGSSYPESRHESVSTSISTILDTASEDDFSIVEKGRRSSTKPSAALAPAWSMYLQGSSKRAVETLFLFPDGCGAATSYLSLPTIASSTAVVAFNSPCMKKPEILGEHTLDEVVQSYVAGVRSRQPKGPYKLGGWSAGGILAYAVARALLDAGEEVASMTLIDSPPPNRGLDRLPDRFFDHCTSVGIFGNEMQRSDGTSNIPDWLMPHFKASIELLHDYHAPALPADKIKDMKVTVIWAGDCAFDGVKYAKLPPATTDSDEDTEGMKFLSEKRTDSGPGEWQGLFPGVKINAATIEGEHHFSMMRDQGAQELIRHVRESLA